MSKKPKIKCYVTSCEFNEANECAIINDPERGIDYVIVVPNPFSAKPPACCDSYEPREEKGVSS